jgi:hypothetical protein
MEVTPSRKTRALEVVDQSLGEWNYYMDTVGSGLL